MTFEQFLNDNNLPPINTIITTPAGDDLKVLYYIFDEKGERVCIGTLDNLIEWHWDFNTVRKCKQKPNCKKKYTEGGE